jgi:hypothetical protein
MTEPRWRVGRKLGRTLYRDEICVGMVDTEVIAQAIVDRMNAAEVREPELPKLVFDRGIAIEELPWLVKDFDVLYRVAQRAIAQLAKTTVYADGNAMPCRLAVDDLGAQLERLAPAHEQIQATRRLYLGPLGDE